jgi:hypothetical protein
MTTEPEPEQHQPYEGYIDLKAADDGSGCYVVMKVTRFDNKTVDRTVNKGFLPKPPGVSFDAWFREISFDLKCHMDTE